MRQIFIVAMLTFILSTSVAFAGERDADHEALRGLMKASSEALNTSNFDLLKPTLSSKNFTFITVDNQRFNNLEEFKSYWEKTFNGKTALLKSVKVEPTATGETQFLSDNVGFVDGTAEETYTFRDGDVRKMTTRWTAVVSKEDDAWKIAQIHFSSNILDNPVLSAAKKAAGSNILIPALVGFALGALLLGVIRRKKTA